MCLPMHKRTSIFFPSGGLIMQTDLNSISLCSWQGHREVKPAKSNEPVAEQTCNSAPTRLHLDHNTAMRNQFSNLSLETWFTNQCCMISLSLSIKLSGYTLLRTVFQIGCIIPTLDFKLFIGKTPLKWVHSLEILTQASLKLQVFSYTNLNSNKNSEL